MTQARGPRTGPSIDDIKAAANARPGEILSRLGINEQPNAAGLIAMRDPKSKDVNPSFAIWIKNGIVTFKRFGSPYAGDIVDLVAYMRDWADLPKKGRGLALRWLIDALKLDTIDPAQLARDTARAKRRQSEEHKDAAEKLARAQGRARSLFITAASPLEAHHPPWRYLAGRGIDLDKLPRGPRGGLRTPGALRYLMGHKHAESGSALPCMIACCTDCNTEQILAVHRTWLSVSALGAVSKANVEPVKKVWPAFSGLIIPLWRGDTNMSVRDATANGVRETLVLTEGIEDALSAALAAPQYRTWAFIALDNLKNVRLPECIDGVIVHRQNEWENAKAVAAFERGVTALKRQGRPVVEVAARAGKDLNDTLRGAA